MGGLGNQLFQIFTTLAYSIRHHRKMVLPYSDVLTVGINRPTYWESFLSSLKKFTTYVESYRITNDDINTFARYNEPFHHYSEIPMVTNNQFVLFGYYQSYKYFENEDKAIFAKINLQKQQENVAAEYSDYLNKSHIITSMHFRLGDYKVKQDYHPIMPYEYYDNALLNILLYSDLTKHHRILYFCEKEDNDIVNKMIIKLQRKYVAFEFIKVDDTIEDWKQLLIMSCCNNNIIANSSFSWWGGYFNQNINKIVCYPNIWFGPSVSRLTIDMFPETWNCVEW
jgi:hypothetical protein